VRATADRYNSIISHDSIFDAIRSAIASTRPLPFTFVTVLIEISSVDAFDCCELQTVRADLKELRDLDLEGAPYGYTPFCDSRTDMDGYR